MPRTRTLPIALLLIVCLVLASLGLSGCTPAQEYKKYTYEFYGSFDTVIQFLGYARSESEFQRYAKIGEARFLELHKLFDIYNDHPGLATVKTVNDQAGIAPVAVARDLIDLVVMAKEWNAKTGGSVNIALGPVLAIWHDYRDAGIADPENASLPPREELEAAARHTDIDKVVVDREKGTIFLQEKGMRLDLGSVGKGYACEVVAKELESAGLTSVIVNGGGNIRLVGRPLDGQRQRWGVGIQNPDGNVDKPDDTPLDILFLHDTSFVTSGDYQRYYTVEGKRYNHLIDPTTLMPAEHFRAVSVVYPDSGIADFLSSTFYILSFEQGRALAERIEGVEVAWVFEGNRIEATDGMKKWMKDLGGASSTTP